MIKREDMTVINMIKSNFSLRVKDRESFLNACKTLDENVLNREEFASVFIQPVFSIYDHYYNIDDNDRINKIIKFINL